MPSVDPRSVFINAPFDDRYEPLFVTLVGSLVFLDLEPRCVLEVRETGQGRLHRIFDLISGCGMSFHDISRVGTPVRFNMPFELGLACAIHLSAPSSHDVVVLDAEPYRMDRTLSDYKGRDPLIHHNRCDELVGVVLDVLHGKSVPAVADLRAGARELRRAARDLKHDFQSSSVFRPAIFRLLLAAAAKIAVARGFVVGAAASHRQPTTDNQQPS